MGKGEKIKASMPLRVCMAWPACIGCEAAQQGNQPLHAGHVPSLSSTGAAAQQVAFLELCSPISPGVLPGGWAGLCRLVPPCVTLIIIMSASPAEPAWPSQQGCWQQRLRACCLLLAPLAAAAAAASLALPASSCASLLLLQPPRGSCPAAVAGLACGHHFLPCCQHAAAWGHRPRDLHSSSGPFFKAEKL